MSALQIAKLSYHKLQLHGLKSEAEYLPVNYIKIIKTDLEESYKVPKLLVQSNLLQVEPTEAHQEANEVAADA